jgi:hypothetical protein
MITTGCEGCCFFVSDDTGKGCAIKQLCVSKNGRVFAPGYCRMCRSRKWAKKQNTADMSQLHEKVIDEMALRFDLLVFFDEAHNTAGDLEKTLGPNWYRPYAKKVIIMDTTGFGERKNLALQYLQAKKHSIQTVVDSSSEHETIDQRGDTLRRVSKQVKSPFFMAISAGNTLFNLHTLARKVQHVSSRVIHWTFPFAIGSTATIPQELNYGLFITMPYKELMKSPIKESFTQRLWIEEEETGMGLSWLFAESWLV